MSGHVRPCARGDHRDVPAAGPPLIGLGISLWRDQRSLVTGPPVQPVGAESVTV
jgi:hypothetical protein